MNGDEVALADTLNLNARKPIGHGARQKEVHRMLIRSRRGQGRAKLDVQPQSPALRHEILAIRTIPGNNRIEPP